MSDVVEFPRRKVSDQKIKFIEKVVDGEIIQCTIVDALSPAEWVDFFTEEEASCTTLPICYPAQIAQEMHMEKELKDQRIPVMFSKSEVDLIDDWMFAKRIRSRGEAIRQLCRKQIIRDRRLIDDGKFKKLMDEAATHNVEEDSIDD